MKEGPDIVRIAALVGDPARANMLLALMSGRALTPTELSIETGITPQTASFHIAKLQEGGLLTLRKQGRHKYVALAGQDVADVRASGRASSPTSNVSVVVRRTRPEGLRSRPAILRSVSAVSSAIACAAASSSSPAGVAT